MIIGFIGAGDMATTIAQLALKAGHLVRMLGRDQQKLSATIAALGDGASAAAPDDIVTADIIVLAVDWANVGAALTLCPPPPGSILVDATNAILKHAGSFEIAEFGDKISSDIVGELAPGAHVVKAFNTIRTEDLRAGPWRGDCQRFLMVSGDDAEAKERVTNLIQSFGFLVVDLGNLANGGRLQSFGGPLATGQDFLVAGVTIDETI